MAAITHRIAEPLVFSKVSREGLTRLAAAPPVEAKRPSRVAVFVTHGMGQQAPFETLDAVADGLIRAAGGITTPDVAACAVRSETQDLQRLEFGIHNKNGNDVLVHVYEAYWAPLTEGQVTLRDVMGFLFSAGTNGLRNCCKDFMRWMFGKPVNFGLHFRTTIQLLAALAVVFSLVVMNGVIATVAGARILVQGVAKPWPGDALLSSFNTVMVGFVAVSLACGLALLLAPIVRPAQPGKSPVWRGLMFLLQLLFWFWIAVTILSGIAFVAALAADRFGCDLSWLLACPNFAGKEWLWMWVVLIGISYVVRQFLIQYLGDVAAYVSSHTLDRFNQLRQTIKKTVFDKAHAVYSAADKSGNYLYDHVFVVGHSLGSVISYDTLNALLNDDVQAQTAPPDDANAVDLAVADRTKLLLTFGSPLDKVAFLFARTNATDHQRALAASVQPLIQDYARFRKTQWINVYASRDIISGRLEFFDDPDVPATTVNKIQPREDPDALIPVVAHIEYWRNPTVFDELYANI